MVRCCTVKEILDHLQDFKVDSSILVTQPWIPSRPSSQESEDEERISYGRFLRRPVGSCRSHVHPTGIFSRGSSLPFASGGAPVGPLSKLQTGAQDGAGLLAGNAEQRVCQWVTAAPK